MSGNRTWHGYWNSRSSRETVVVYSKRATSRVRFDLPHPPGARLKRILVKRTGGWESRSRGWKKKKRKKEASPFYARYIQLTLVRSYLLFAVAYLLLSRGWIISFVSERNSWKGAPNFSIARRVFVNFRSLESGRKTKPFRTRRRWRTGKLLSSLFVRGERNVCTSVHMHRIFESQGNSQLQSDKYNSRQLPTAIPTGKISLAPPRFLHPPFVLG